MSYNIEDGPVGIAGELILGGISDKTLLVCESYPRRCDTVTCEACQIVWCKNAQLEAYPGR